MAKIKKKRKKAKKIYQKNWFIIILVIILLIISLIVGYKIASNNNQAKHAENDITNTTKSSTKELNEEDLFNNIVSNVPSVNKDNYNEEDYYMPNYKELLRDPNKFFYEKLKVINGEIIQKKEVGNYVTYLVMQPTDDIYMLFIEKDRLENNLIENDVVHFNGQSVLTYKYINNAGNEKEVPLIYINSYILTKS